MKLFWKIFASIFFSFVVTVSLTSYVISIRQIADVEKDIIEDTKILGSFLSKEIEVGYFESKWPFESLKKLSNHKGILFWWIVRDDGTIHLADDASFMETYAQDYFPQIAGMAEKDKISLNHKQNYGIFFTPLETGPKKWSFWFGFSLSQISERRKEIIFLIVATSLSSLVVLGFILYIAIKYFTEPIREITLSTEHIGKGDLTHRVRIKSKDELGQLAHSFNKMTEDLQKTTVSKDYVDNIIESMIDALIVVDPNGKIITVNKATRELSGYQEEELLGNSIETIFPEAEEIYFKEKTLEKLIKEGELRNYETHLKDKDSKNIPILFNGSVVKDKDGRMIRIVCTARDITEHKQTEQTLIRSEETAKRLSQENEIIAEIGRIISSTLNIEEIYERFAEEAKKLIPFDRIVINTIDIEKGTVLNVYMAGQGITDREVGKIYSLEGSGNAEMVCTKSSLLIQTEDFEEYKDRFPMLLSTFQAGFRSIMNVPLFLKGKIIGGLLLRSLKPYAYTDNDVRLAERVGHQIAGAIVNAQLFKDLQKAIAEVKQLSGLLPICSGCKKIRDNKGYWNQIEEYISDHSEAIFSHGLCPECLKKLYPDF